MASPTELPDGAPTAGEPTPVDSRTPVDAPASGGRRRIVIGAVLVIGVALLVAVMTMDLSRPVGPVDSPFIDQPAPAFDLEALTGERVALAGLRGLPVVINFWASWCVPCRREAPLLTAADRTYRSDGLRILGVVYQDTPDAARAFMREFGQTFPGLLDPDGRTAIDYGVFGIPETFFIDRDGVVRVRHVGEIDGPTLERQIEGILR